MFAFIAIYVRLMKWKVDCKSPANGTIRVYTKGVNAESQESQVKELRIP